MYKTLIQAHKMKLPLYRIVQTRSLLVPRTLESLLPGDELYEYGCEDNRYPEPAGR